ncbi:minichromosome maintenance protein 10 [Trypanosoma theileri]|uniref:Protein MCM10 homolog n=1 Tax=Trypanosoma theileri TaxID=67003 RepID=A0A1X0P7F7_9TRYP|nr:minichromosome maintenance protein 10 [Trypanosoma theileri]ORC92808.1 minichromosome maintenance protein 10 [Trypanosoma theileri]
MTESVNCVNSINNNNNNNNGDDDDDDDDDDDLFAVFDTPGAKEESINSHSAALPLSGSYENNNIIGGNVESFQRTQSSISSVSITEVLNKATTSTSSAAASIMSIVQGTSNESLVDDIDTVGQRQHRPRATLVKEPKSGINISRPTKSCEQLPVILVQHPFRTFTEARRILNGGDTQQSLMIIGVVTRKTDPKQKNGKHAYGVISLWNMQGPFPTPIEEMAILFGGSAFDVHYTKLANGVVLGLSGVQRMENRGGTSSSTSSSYTSTTGNSNNDNGSQMLKVVTSEQVRVLGYAADLGTCQGIQQRTGEHCNYMVNSALSKYCSHHAMNLRREARGNISVNTTTTTTTTTKMQTPWGTNRSSSSSVNAALPAGTTRVNLSSLNPAMPTASKSTLQALARQQQGFLTVKGSCGLPTHSPSASDVSSAGGAYAGVVAGRALPVTGICRDTTRVFNTPTALGVTSRGRAVLAAAVDQEDAKETQRLLQRAMGRNETGVKRTRSESVKSTLTSAIQNKLPTTTATTARTSSNTISSTEKELEAIRAQYAPLTSDSSTAFAPMRGGGGFNEVLLRREDYANHVVTKRSNGTTSALVSTVARQLRNDGLLSKSGSTLTNEEQQRQSGNAPRPVSLLGVVAGSMQSTNEELRKINVKQQFEQRMERRLTQDKALEALSKITEQKVKCVFCRQCDRWYMKRNERCKMLHHTLIAGETTRHFIECEHCSYKTTVLGDARPSKIIPRCPRCSAASVWRPSNAAPELAAPKEVPPQL